MSMQALQDNYKNEHAKLLDYLESFKPKSGPKPISVNKKDVSEHSKTPVKDKVKKHTQDIIAECKDIPEKKVSTLVIEKPKKKKINTNYSTGFDVKKFETLMRSKLIDEYKKLQSYDRPYLSVTEIISCFRRVYYQRQKYPIEVKNQYNFSYLYLINNIGNSVHDCIQSLYDFEEVEKTIISEKYKIKGRVDGIHGNFLIEIKTIDEDKFENAYIPMHYNQGLIYSYILNEEYNYNIKTITIVYVIRNLKKIIPFDLEYSISKAFPFFKESIKLKKSLDIQKVPDPINADKEQCRFCPYLKYCANDGSDKIELPFNKKSNNVLDYRNMNNSMFSL